MSEQDDDNRGFSRRGVLIPRLWFKMNQEGNIRIMQQGCRDQSFRAEDLGESRGGVPDSLYGLCGRKIEGEEGTMCWSILLVSEDILWVFTCVLA